MIRSRVTLPSVRLSLSLAYALALVLGVGATALAPTGRALADGPHVRSQEVFAGRVGPYDVKVLTLPVVGTMHLSTSIAPQGVSNAVVTDARVQMSASGPQGGAQVLGPEEASNAFGSPGWYGFNLPINQTGMWAFTVAV